MKILGLAFDLFNGIYSGFPLCCVLNFVWLMAFDIPPGYYMDQTYGYDRIFGRKYDKAYVRCCRCRKSGRVAWKQRSGGLVHPERWDEHKYWWWNGVRDE